MITAPGGKYEIHNSGGKKTDDAFNKSLFFDFTDYDQNQTAIKDLFIRTVESNNFVYLDKSLSIKPKDTILYRNYANNIRALAEKLNAYVQQGGSTKNKRLSKNHRKIKKSHND